MHCALQAYSHMHMLFFHRQGVSWATCSRGMHRELPTRGFREGEGAVVWKWPSKVQKQVPLVLPVLRMWHLGWRVASRAGPPGEALAFGRRRRFVESRRDHWEEP